MSSSKIQTVRNGALDEMVERQLQYVNIRRVENRRSEVTMKRGGFIKTFKTESRQSITMDNGIEFKYHEKLKISLEHPDLFLSTTPLRRKGLVEQINGLIRCFVLKKTGLSKITKKGIGVIEILLNSRPRKLLKWKASAEVFARKSGINLVDGAFATRTRPWQSIGITID